MLYTMQGLAGYPDFDVNDNDEDYGSHWSRFQTNIVSPEGADILAAPIAAMPSASSSTSSPSEGSTPVFPPPATPQNRCVFPPGDASVMLVPRKRKVGSVADPIAPAAASSPIEAAVARPPVYALIDSESRRRKENAVVDLSSDDDMYPQHSSGGPVRAQALETGYGHIRRNVLTDEKITWLEGRLDFGYKKLGLNPVDFPSVTEKEQDLMHDRVWSTRKTAKQAARDIVKGPNGYGFIQSTLLHKLGLVFSDPSDRTIKGSMYKHPAIQAMAEATVFKNLLADAVQYPELFDDAPQPLDEDPAPSQPPHKPQFSAVAITVFISALRGAISEWSSGHWVAESFLRKIYYSQFVTDLKTFREWQEYTSNSTVLTGHGPTRTVPPSFLARKFQESITEKARMKIFKDIVAPIPSAEVMETFDFALNQ
ncbi:hypothetical protein B0H14DRAFT_3652965 [Mycena olivaceomarginata]|nr:hypothetical protein B0H14DRAFT_3652965 [Mycena olivaceomarginata]